MSTDIRERLAIADKSPLLPNDKTEESLVLGALYVDYANYDEITAVLDTPEYFYDLSHRQLYQVLAADIEAGRDRPDPPSIIPKLTAIATHEDRGVFLQELEALGSGVADVRRHVEILREFWLKRKGILKARALIKDLSHSNGVAASKILNDASMDIVDTLSDLDTTSVAVHPKDFSERRIACMIERQTRGTILTGMPFLDKKLLGGGFLPKKFSVIVGRPSEGKTALKHNIMLHWGKTGIGVLNLPFEPGIDDEMDRLDSVVTSIPLGDFAKIKEWSKDDPRKDVVDDAQVNILGKWNLTHNDSGRLTIDRLPMEIRQTRRHHRVDIVLIDVLGAMPGLTDWGDNLTLAINYHIKKLRRIAHDMNVHICVVTHLGREFEKKQGKKKQPTMADIKQSGSYEEDADVILAVDRPRVHDHSLPHDYQRVTILKQKNGPAGFEYTSWNRFNKDTLRLENFSETNPYETESSSGEVVIRGVG